MQLDFAFLAQVADFLVSDGKLVAWGIGIDGIEASTMPFQASPMALVARLLLPESEPKQDHTYTVTMTNPAGDEKVLCESERLNTQHHSIEPPSASNLIVSLTIFFLTAGVYKFRLVVDGELLKELPIRVSHAQATAAGV